jgi:hypothetical protein
MAASLPSRITTRVSSYIKAKQSLNDGALLGIVSIGDLVKSIISDREFVIAQLEHYIHG